MRIRTIKPEFFTHEGIFEAEMESKLPLRLAFIGLWCAADREGRFKWEPRRLGVSILPYDSKDFSRVLDALCTRGFIVKYTVNGAWFGYIPSFSRHQVINNRESDSIIPKVPDTQPDDLLESRVDDACLTRDSRQKEEGKGREEEGKLLSASADERDVEKIFQAYPAKRRGGRKEAHKAIRGALKDISAESLLANVESYAKSQDVQEKARKGEWSFVPLLSTWMNKGRYDAGENSFFDQDHNRNPLVDTSHLPRSGEMVQLTANDI